MSTNKMNDCPKCGSELFMDLDIITNNRIERCILCGYIRDVEPSLWGMSPLAVSREMTITEMKGQMKKRRRRKSEGWLR